MKKKQRIGIIGIGMVGSQILRWFKKNKFEVFGYDKYKKIGKLKDLEKADVIFLCVPTPYHAKTGFDIKPLEENIGYFKNSKIFVIKSTVLPGTTDYLQKKYSIHSFLFNPEFLTEITAEKDFFNPLLQIVGYTACTPKIASSILNILPNAKYAKITTAKTAEIFKYVRNAFFSMKVIFANQIYDLCTGLNINYEDVRELMGKEPWIGENHINIYHKDYRGFGGKCLPKDLKALIHLYKKLNLKPRLFEVVDNINYQLLKEQKLLKKLKNHWLNNKN